MQHAGYEAHAMGTRESDSPASALPTKDTETRLLLLPLCGRAAKATVQGGARESSPGATPLAARCSGGAIKTILLSAALLARPGCVAEGAGGLPTAFRAGLSLGQ